MTIIHTQRNFAPDDPHASNVSHVRDLNHGGFAQGVARASGRYGGQLVGAAGKVFGGVLGVSGAVAMLLEIEDADGDFYQITTDTLTESQVNTRFSIDPAVQGHIPRGCRVWVSLNMGGASSDVAYWYLMTS